MTDYDFYLNSIAPIPRAHKAKDPATTRRWLLPLVPRARLFIKCVESGEVRECSQQFWEIDSDASPSWVWEKGNYSCDCNREMLYEDRYFCDARPKCSEGRYLIHKIVVDDQVVYSETVEDSA